MAANLVGHVLGVVGALGSIDGPSTDTGANGLGQRNPLGCRSFDDAGAEYIYLAGIASTVAGDWVRFNHLAANSPFTTARVNNDAIAGAVAVAMSAAVAVTSFAWYQIYGLVLVANLTTGSIDGSQISLSATAGRCSGAATATKVVFNATAVGAAAANLGKCFIQYPYTLGTDPV